MFELLSDWQSNKPKWARMTFQVDLPVYNVADQRQKLAPKKAYQPVRP